MKAISIRLPDDLAKRIEDAATEAGNSLNTQVVDMLFRAKSADSLALTVRVPIDVARRSAVYYVTESQGMDPVVDTPADLERWVTYVLLEAGGFDEGDASLHVSSVGDHVVITGNLEIMRVIQSYILE